MNTIYIKALNGEALTKHELMRLIKEVKSQEIYELAHQITRKFMGNSFDSCSIINAKSGNCPEDCKWCSQSAHNNAKIDIYPLITKEEAIKQAIYNSGQGVKRFSLVTSGKRVSKKEIGQICDIVKSLPKTVIPCVSLGLIDKEDLQKLYDAGVTRYHCNIESSPNYFKKLCTTHTTEDKLKTLNAARQVGMSLCSGGIIGMGETMEERIDMALFLREQNILSIPINVLHPIPGTKLENSSPLTDEEYLLSVSLFRIINPKAFLRFAGGRALLSKKIQQQALYIGINSAIMGDMLTTLGSGTREDMEMFAAAHYLTHLNLPKCATPAAEASVEPVDAKLNTLSELESRIWHPYSSVTNPTPTFLVESAHGVKIKLEDGTELVDGMSSWWAAMHGYNHPALNKAATEQIAKMSHIMFGGFTHRPVQELTRLLLEVLPKNGTEEVLTKFFYSDSGSISVEVALKMAIQYWATQGNHSKTKFATVRNGYHGDTWNAMSVCDPVTGMHSLFGSSLPINFFAPAPQTKFGEHQLVDNDIEPVEKILKEHSH
ncbi:MAG: biotin synthase BioB, partial [Bacteroidales bacterium]